MCLLFIIILWEINISGIIRINPLQKSWTVLSFGSLEMKIDIIIIKIK